MSVRQRVPRYAAAAALLVTLTGCGADTGSGAAGPSPATGSSSAAASTSPTGSPTGSPSTASPSGTGSAGGPTGSPSSPTPLSASTHVLRWSAVPGPARDTTTRGGGWTLTVTGNGSGWTLDGPGTGRGGGASGRKVSDALLDQHWAVVVQQDAHEARPSVAEVIDLRTGRRSAIDGGSDVPTTTGGSWTLAGDRLLHATYGPHRAYCVATADLSTGRSTLGWCAPPRHGFNGARIGSGGDSVMSFDAGRPSCRTLVAVDGSRGTPFPGVPPCTAWDGVRTTDGAVWSVVPNAHQVEAAHFYAHSGDRWLDLGPGSSGSLVWCGNAAWFGRDPQRDGDPAELMRWSAADGLSVAYRSHGSRAFLSAPRCGGDTITVTAFTDAGDEQVSAPVG